MKSRYSLFYPFSFALAAVLPQSSYGQAVEVAPVEVVGEDLRKDSDSADQTVEVAKQNREVAKLAARTAEKGGKEQALAEVKAAQKRLDDTVAKVKTGKDEESRGGKMDKSDSEKKEKEDHNAPKPSNDKVDKKAGNKQTPEEAVGGVPSEPEMIPDEGEGQGQRGVKEDNAADPIAGEEPEMKKGAEDMRSPEAEITEKDEKVEPAPEEPREAIAETKLEAVEAEEADKAVDLTTKKVEEQADKRKLGIKDKGEARNLIRDLIGAESEVSKAEAARETRLDPRGRRDDMQGRDGVEKDDIRGASDFLLRQLTGRAKPEEAPAFFRRPAVNHRDGRTGGRNALPQRFEPAPPRYFHEGRRYVRFDSRNSIPAILLAAAALERVSVLPANRTDGYFPDERGKNNYANDLPPENFRGEESVVVSYPVSASSMISSNDIIFAQGSTRFADAHSYDMVLALGDAMGNPALKEARFVIEGHASAEGSYEGNMALSQRRAEAIVRDMVREGIDPERLIPVGYGESEARYPADAAESLRSQDRNVRVFRMDGKP